MKEDVSLLFFLSSYKVLNSFKGIPTASHLHASIPSPGPSSCSATHTWTSVPTSKAQTRIGDYGLLFSLALAFPFLNIFFEAEGV